MVPNANIWGCEGEYITKVYRLWSLAILSVISRRSLDKDLQKKSPFEKFTRARVATTQNTARLSSICRYVVQIVQFVNFIHTNDYSQCISLFTFETRDVVYNIK